MDDTTLVESVWMQALQVFTPAGLLLVATLGTMLTMCSTLLVVDIVQPSCLMRYTQYTTNVVCQQHTVCCSP